MQLSAIVVRLCYNYLFIWYRSLDWGKLQHQPVRSLSAVFMYVIYPQAQGQRADMAERARKSDILRLAFCWLWTFMAVVCIYSY